MTHLPPFRTRQSAQPSSADNEADFDDELPLLGEDAILERGELEPEPAADDGVPWGEPAEDDGPPWDASVPNQGQPRNAFPAQTRTVSAPAPDVEDEAVAELLRDLNDVVPAATLAGAWAAQYETASRRTGAYAVEPAPPVLTEVLHEPPVVRALPPVPPAGAWEQRDDVQTESIDAAPEPTSAAAYASTANDVNGSEDMSEDTGLSASDERLAENIADSVMAALLPTLRDTVLDAVRDTLAARRHQS